MQFVIATSQLNRQDIAQGAQQSLFLLREDATGVKEQEVILNPPDHWG
jgi:hypothetical protein